MLPFSIERLIMDMEYDISSISTDLIRCKFKFCTEFEKELSLQANEYSQTVFDYLYNLFFFKKAFGEIKFKKYLEQFKDIDFRNPSSVCGYVSKMYQVFLVSYKEYFMDYFGFNHEDPLYIQQKIDQNRSAFREKILEYY